MSSTIILKAAGLNTSPNRLEVPDGSFSEASNIIVRRDGIIEQRRGFLLYGDSLPSINQRVKQLSVYRDRIIRHYASSLQYDSNGSGTFGTYTGTVSETEAGTRIKFVESNGNLYFTTSEGIKKLSSKNAVGLSSTEIDMSGAVKALDLEGKVLYTPNNQTGFLPQDSVIAYRVVWNKKDANNNLITGTPSQRAVIYNPLFNLIAQDFARVLSVLDNLTNSPASSVRINDKNYVQSLLLPITSSPSELRTNLIALAAKIDNDILYADQSAVAPLQVVSAAISTGICTITFTGTVTDYFEAGSKIFLAGFAPVTGTLDGAQIVVSTTATTVTFNTLATGVVTLTSATVKSNEFRAITQPVVPNIPAQNDDLVDQQDYLDSIILGLQDASTFIIAAGADTTAIQGLDITTTVTVDLDFTIPEEVADDAAYFYQVYRSAIAQATQATVLDDISPNDELQLVYEEYPTAAELLAGAISIEDVTPEDFRGQNLYTNASTGEGITQANDQPPFAKDVSRYRNSVFFANTRTKQRLALNLLGVQQMIDDYDAGTVPKISITNGTVTNTYSFITGQQQIRRYTSVADVANSLDGKYLTINTPDIKYYVWFSTGAGAVDPGPITSGLTGYIGIRVNIVTNDSAIDVTTKFKNAVSLYITEFITTVISSTVTEITNVDVGYIIGEGDGNTGFSYSQQQAGRGERLLPQITRFVACVGSDFETVGPADYVQINSAYDQNRYVIWFNTGVVTQPVVAGATLIEVVITGSETATQVAEKVVAKLPASQFDATNVSQFITITNRQLGTTSQASASVGSGTFLVSTPQEGAVDILLSPFASPARAVDATARSITRILNKNLGESVYVYYLSGAFDIPGKMLLEARTLQNTEPFYVTVNNSITGTSFNPVISPENTITAISTGTAAIITTATPHGMENGDETIIVGSDSTPIVDGLHTITYISPTTFSIAKYVSVAGTEGSITSPDFALASENEEKSNRVYYSKFQQPEAVPIVNYFDVGSEDKKILRIAPLRDSLFVFKEDGLFRISGDSAPFQLELFDSSYILLAPDSVAVCNNVLYSWTTQGIQSLTEGGSFVISRNIDNIILKTQSSNYVNFKKATWGLGYESDNSYIVYTVLDREDTNAEIAYRYSTLTQTWTTYDKTNSCGVVNNFDDKLYLGATDVSYIEQERKSFDRTDYADRQYETEIGSNTLFGNTISIPDVTNVQIGDVFLQEQTLTVYEYNMLLKKLDMDTGIADSNFFSTLQMSQGDSPRNKLVALATKLDADASVALTNFSSSIGDKSGTITSITAAASTVLTSTAHGLIDGRVIRISGSDSTPSIDGEYPVTVLSANTFSIPLNVRIPGTTAIWQTVTDNFDDIATCYNFIIVNLNDDININFANYKMISNTTIQEAIVTNINRVTRKITLNLELEFMVGTATIYKAITSTFTYSPSTFGDPLMLKHLSEATIMFETRTLTSATVSFATDLLPEFIPVPFNLDGNGIFGHSNFGTGFFGGLSNSAPFRTYVPRQCQRCRYIVVKYSHSVAREDYRILGMTVSGNIQQSIRAFR